MRHSLLLLLAASLLLPSLNTEAAVLPTYSEDQFDGSPYTAGAPLVIGTGEITHGYWQTNHAGSGASTITDDSSLSPSNALALTSGSQDPEGPIIRLKSSWCSPLMGRPRASQRGPCRSALPLT